MHGVTACAMPSPTGRFQSQLGSRLLMESICLTLEIVMFWLLQLPATPIAS